MANENEETETGPSGSDFQESDVVSLGEKLASLHLTDGERAALGALLADDEVTGFGRFGPSIDVIGRIREGMGFRYPIDMVVGQRADRDVGTSAIDKASPELGAHPRPGRL